MDAFFTGLTKRQAMLLLTAVTFGGQEGVESFAFLPDAEGEVLSDRARQILAIPREKRVPFLVQEIKRFVTGRKGEDLRSADPKGVADALRKERPALVEVVLRSLPSPLASDVRIELAQPVLEREKEIKPEILAVIRWKFEQLLAGCMPKPRGFAVVDLLVLTGSDLICLADVLGAAEIAPPVASLQDAERDGWLQQLPPDQRVLVKRALAAKQPARRADPEIARRALAEAAEGGEPRDAVRLSGMHRVARACLTESPEFAARLIEKHRGELGRQLARCVSAERQGARRPDEAAKREVIGQLDSLAERGVIERPVRLPPPPIPRRPAPAAPRDLGSSGPRAPGPAARPSVSPARAPSPASGTPQRAPSGSPPRVSAQVPRVSGSPPRGPVPAPRVSVSTPRVSVSTPRVSVSTPRVSISMQRAADPAPRIQRGGAAAEPPAQQPARRPVPAPTTPLRGPRKP